MPIVIAFLLVLLPCSFVGCAIIERNAINECRYKLPLLMPSKEQYCRGIYRAKILPFLDEIEIKETE